MLVVIEFDGKQDKNESDVVQREWLTPARKEVFCHHSKCQIISTSPILMGPHLTISDDNHGFSVVAKRLLKIESEILSIKEYLEDYLPRLESYTQSGKDKDTINSIPPLPCLTKEDVEKLKEWLSEIKNGEALVLQKTTGP